MRCPHTRRSCVKNFLDRAFGIMVSAQTGSQFFDKITSGHNNLEIDSEKWR
jgi:hypothetical protein